MNIKLNKENEKFYKEALGLKKTEKIPIALRAEGNFLINWLKIPARDYILNPVVTLNAQLKFIERFKGIRGVVMGPDYGMALLPSIFGAKIHWKENDVPWVEPLIKNKSDLEEFVNEAKFPEPMYSGLMPAFFSTYYFMKKEMGNFMDFPKSTNSPYCLADYLCGSTNLYTWVVDFPELVLRLMQKLKIYLVKHLRRIQEILEFEYDVILMKDDQSSYLNPKQFNIFINPFCDEIFEEVGTKGVYRMWHSDGPLFNNIDNIISMKINALERFDPNVDILKFKEAIGGKMCLIGNIHPIKILRNGNPDIVMEECRRQIKVMKDTGGYVLAPGGEIIAGTPEENIDSIIASV